MLKKKLSVLILFTLGLTGFQVQAQSETTGVTFSVPTYSVGYKTRLQSPPFLVLEKVPSGVSMKVTHSNQVESQLALQLLDYLRANLKSSSRRVFETEGSILITTGLRSRPTPEQLNALLEEVVQTLQPKAAALRLLTTKSVTFNN